MRVYMYNLSIYIYIYICVYNIYIYIYILSTQRLYSRKAHIHHYTDFMEQGIFDEARENVSSLMKDYMYYYYY